MVFTFFLWWAKLFLKAQTLNIILILFIVSQKIRLPAYMSADFCSVGPLLALKNILG